MNDSRDNIPFYAVSYEQVLLALAAIALAAGLSILNRSRLERQFLWGAIRSFLQLWMVGYVLVFLFDSRNMPLLILTVEFQILMGAYTAGKSQDFSSRQTFLALCIALHVAIWGIGAYLYGAVLRVNPFEAPHLLIPVMGMLIGNSASGAALSVHRLRSEIESHKGEIEAALALGATPVKALEPYVAATMRNALIPSINSMMLMGIVQLPGMMTGQMIAGIVPHQAVRYQIIIIYIIAGVVALSCYLTVKLESRRFFTRHWGLVLP